MAAPGNIDALSAQDRAAPDIKSIKYDSFIDVQGVVMLHGIEFNPPATARDLAPGEYVIENVGTFTYKISQAGIGFFRRELSDKEDARDLNLKLNSNLDKLLRIEYNLRFKSKKI